MPLDESPDLAQSTTDWPPLDRSLLGDTQPPLPAFPLPLLPGRWREWVEASSRVFGSADYLAHCLLGGVASVGGAGIRIGITSHWREPLLFWQALIGGPASGKSASFERVRRLLDAVWPWEAEHRQRGVPVVLVDAGLDPAHSALRGSPRGVLLWREDLADWMDEARRRTARPAWLAGWSAGSARIGRHPEDCLAVGLLGAVGPERLASLVDGDSALASRFLYVWPARGIQEVSLADSGADDEGIVALLQKIADFAGHREMPCVVPLDGAGVRRLEGLMPALRRRAEEAEGVEAEWIGRGVPTVVRLAGLLSLMQWAETDAEWSPVGAAHIEAAHELWSTYYLPHALGAFDRTGVAGCERAARKVARWLKRVRAPEISREDVRREALNQAVTAEVAEDVLARLEEGGLLRPVPASGSAKGGPRRRRWAVHPQLG
jgi:hypothetical protein